MSSILPILAAMLVALLALTGQPAAAQDRRPGPAAPLDSRAAALAADFAGLLGLDDTFAAMREEGLDYGRRLEEDLFTDRGGAAWAGVVGRIYAPDRMRDLFLPVLGRELAALPAPALAAARDFLASGEGRRIVSLENSARAAQLDPEVKAQSEIAAEEAEVSDPARFALLRRLVAAGDLIEANVVGGLNANAAFYFALNGAGAFPEPLSDEEVLADVVSQEDAIRAETEAWIYPYLLLAYRPLAEAELARYLAFSESAPGRALNRAAFAAYDAMFIAISRDLGREAARFIVSRDL